MEPLLSARSRRRGILNTAVALCGLVLLPDAAHSQTLKITGLSLGAGGAPRVSHSADMAHYFVLLRGSTLSDLSHPIDARLGSGATGELSDPAPLASVAFYRVLQIPLSDPLDLDRDGMDDVYELNRAPALDALNPADALQDADGDLRSNLAETEAGSDPLNPDFFVVASPRNGETGVSVNRETILRFTVPLAAGSSLDNQVLWAETGGRRLLTRTELSTDRRTATLFYLEPVPGSSRVRVFFDGTGLRDAQDRSLDLDSDGQPGGIAAIEFTTAGFSAVAGTAIIGQVFASEPAPAPFSPGGFTNRPLAGVTITVDGAEESLRTVTAADGTFSLNPCPAGRFFVHVDGRTVSDPAAGIHWPDLAYYPFVGKAWEARAGILTNLAGGTGEIFLPLIPSGALQPVNAMTETRIGFAPGITNANPALAGVEITVPPNALFSDSGVRGGRVGLAPVDPQRLPEPLPPGLTFPLVITVQTDGPLNFDQPAPVKFPNLPDPGTGRKLAPGEKSALWSFDHDKGTWEIVGPMTVSADGLYVVSDPGVGIRQPGWHGSNPGSGGGGPPPGPPPPRRPFPTPRPPLSPPSPPPPPPPPAPDDSPSDDSSEPDNGSMIPDFPEIPDIPFIDEPHSWGDLVSAITDQLPTMGPDVYGPIVDIGTKGIDMFDDLGDVIGSHTVTDSDGDGIPDVVESRDEFLQAIQDAAEDQLPSAPDNASDASNTLKDWFDIWKELYGEDALRAPGHGRHVPVVRALTRSSPPGPPPAAIPHLMELQQESEDLARLAALQSAFDDYFNALLGSARWTNLSSAGVQFREMGPVLLAMLAAQQSGTDQGVQISSAESATILDVPSDKVSAALRLEVIARLNLTTTFNATGIVLHSDPGATSSDFIDAGEEQAAVARILAEVNAEADAGFETPGGRGLDLVARMGTALGGFFAAYMPAPDLEPSSDNEYPVSLEIFPPGGGVQEQHLTTDGLGRLDGLRVPANAIVIVRWLDPGSFRIAISFFTSGPPGTRFTIPQAIWSETPPATDSDGDGLPDDAERIVGTRIDLADTDGDSVSDSAEVRSHANPLDGIVVQPGIAGSVDTPGKAVDVAVETYDLSRFGGASAVTRILVADGTAGVAVMALESGQPVLLGEVDTPGDARRVALPQSGSLLADEIGLGAVADGSAGLAIVDLSDPTKPRIVHQVALEGVTLGVTVFGGVAYAGSDQGVITAVDLFTGSVLGDLTLGFAIQDLRVHAGVLFVVGPRNNQATLQSVPLLENGLFGVPAGPVGSTGNLSRSGLRLAVGDGLAYMVHGKGYNTWNITDPLAPALIGTGDTTQFGWKQIAPDGTGLGVACVGPNGSDDGAHDISIYDVRDPAQTERFILTVITPGLASAVAVHDGVAYVADGTAGVEIVQYTVSDLGTNPPTVQLRVTPGQAVISGSRVTVDAAVADDVQVRSVELLLDGERIGEDRGWPFEFAFQAPVLSPTKTSFTLQARATDGAGNLGLSSVTLVSLVPDTTPPDIVAIVPGDGRTVFGTDPTVSVSFSEAMDLASINASTFQLWSAGPDGEFDTSDDSPVAGAIVSQLERAYRSVLTFPGAFAPGDYRIVIDASVRDANGNALGHQVLSGFQVRQGDLRNGGTFAVEGSLLTDGVEDQYTFFAKASQSVFFNLEKGAAIPLQWSVEDESGTRVFNRAAIGDPGVIVLPSDGLYRMVLRRTGPMNPDYRVSLWDVPPASTYPIAVGDTVRDGAPAAGAGNIETPGVEDRYTFTASPGQRVYFDILEGQSAGLAWTLVDDTGAEVFDAGFIGDPGVVKLVRAGVYTLTVGNQRSDATETYAFKLWTVPDPQVFPIAVGDTIRDGMPAAGAGNIETPGVEDLYTFTASPGQRVYFDILEGQSAGLAWILTDDTGAEVFHSGFIGDPGVVKLVRGGVYTLTVGNLKSDATETYAFKLWNVPDPQVFPIAVGDTIRDGMPAAGAGNIETPGVEDLYTFTASPGQRVYFDILEGQSAGLAWILTDDTGAEVFHSGFIGDPGVVELVRGGVYTLTVGNLKSDATETYAFKLWNVPDPQVFPIAVGDTIRDGMPAAGAGNIETPGVEDLYTFTTSPGQLVYFDILEGQSAGLAWILTDDTGAEVFHSGFIGDPGVVELVRGGVYTLTVGNLKSDATETYAFELWPVPDPETFALAIGDTVQDGQPAAGAGNIESPGAEDAYTFTATAGQRADFDLLSGASAGLVWRLTDDSGAEVFRSGFFLDHNGIELTRGGVYTLTVGNSRSDARGIYSFQIRSNP